MSPTFVTLPPEIRNEIYSHVFNYDPIRPHIAANGKRLLFHSLHRYSPDFFAASDPRLFLALLEVNHQILDEAETYFYSNMVFCATPQQISAFIKGIGARRRNMIRRVEIRQSISGSSQFDNRDTLELLGTLPKLRTVHITASVRDFTCLQNELIQEGILKIAGKFDIFVHTSCGGLPPAFLGYSMSTAERRYSADYLWSCAKGTNQWTERNLHRTILPEPPGNPGF